jgi:hypothetical protein
MDNNFEISDKIDSAVDELMYFIDTKLKNHRRDDFNMENMNTFLRIIDEFTFKNVDLNSKIAYNIDDIVEVDDDVYEAATIPTETLKNSLNNLDDDDNIIHTLVTMLRDKVSKLSEIVKMYKHNADFEPEQLADRNFNTLLNNIIAIFNAANAAAGGSKKSHKKSRKSHKKSRKH